MPVPCRVVPGWSCVGHDRANCCVQYACVCGCCHRSGRILWQQLASTQRGSIKHGIPS
jgi:hypothetical protein